MLAPLLRQVPGEELLTEQMASVSFHNDHVPLGDRVSVLDFYQHRLLQRLNHQHLNHGCLDTNMQLSSQLIACLLTKPSFLNN